jgi:hypothetical protein
MSKDTTNEAADRAAREIAERRRRYEANEAAKAAKKSGK